MTTPPDLLRVLDQATTAADKVLTIADRARGIAGRGGPRWHRWRALRLRVRAVRVAGNGRADKARELRTRAAIHLAHALRQETPVTSRDTAELRVLLTGREPLEGGQAVAGA
jgi:hypothetical protein